MPTVPITVTGTAILNSTGTAVIPDSAPVVNPAGGVNNYAPLANAALTGNVTLNGVPLASGGGAAGTVLEGLSGASQSFPAISGLAGYGTLYVDPPGLWRALPVGFDSELTLIPGTAWPPGYRISDGVTLGGVYPAAGTTPTGTEPIRIMPPVSGQNRITFVTLAKIVVNNPSTTAQIATFAAALGVADASQVPRPMYPYLGYAHDNDINLEFQETLGPGETRSVIMFRSDTADNNLNGGIPGWPNWTMNPSNTAGRGFLLYPAVAIAVRVAGPVGINCGGVFAVGLVI